MSTNEMFRKWSSLMRGPNANPPMDAEEAYAQQVNRVLGSLPSSKRQEAEQFLATLNSIRDPHGLDALERSLLRDPAVRSAGKTKSGRMDLAQAKAQLFAARKDQLNRIIGNN